MSSDSPAWETCHFCGAPAHDTGGPILQVIVTDENSGEYVVTQDSMEFVTHCRSEAEELQGSMERQAKRFDRDCTYRIEEWTPGVLP